MNDVVEKVARAICVARGYTDPDTLCGKFNTPNGDTYTHRPRWTFYVDEAIAAIDAYEAAKAQERAKWAQLKQPSILERPY